MNGLTFNKTNALAAAGALAGIYFATKHNKGFAMSAVYVLGLAAVGAFVGNKMDSAA